MRIYKAFDDLVQDPEVGLVGAAIIGVIIDKYNNAGGRDCGAVIGAREIAETLRISVKTAKRHMNRLVANGVLQVKPLYPLNNQSFNSRYDGCNQCGEQYPLLDQHHIIPVARGGSDSPVNIVHLCPNCHRLLHASLYLLSQTYIDIIYGVE